MFWFRCFINFAWAMNIGGPFFPSCPLVLHHHVLMFICRAVMCVCPCVCACCRIGNICMYSRCNAISGRSTCPRKRWIAAYYALPRSGSRRGLAWGVIDILFDFVSLIAFYLFVSKRFITLRIILGAIFSRLRGGCRSRYPSPRPQRKAPLRYRFVQKLGNHAKIVLPCATTRQARGLPFHAFYYAHIGWSFAAAKTKIGVQAVGLLNDCYP